MQTLARAHTGLLMLSLLSQAGDHTLGNQLYPLRQC